MNHKNSERLMLICTSIEPIGTVKLFNGKYTGVRFAVTMSDGKSGEYFGMKEQSIANFPIGVPRFYEVSTMDKHGVEIFKFSPISAANLTPEEKAKVQGRAPVSPHSGAPVPPEPPVEREPEVARQHPSAAAIGMKGVTEDTIVAAASMICASMLQATGRVGDDERFLTAYEIREELRQLVTFSLGESPKRTPTNDPSAKDSASISSDQEPLPTATAHQPSDDDLPF